ncbi:MAG: hypothetical protein WA862_02670 [Solirubrobacterales bacterium]
MILLVLVAISAAALSAPVAQAAVARYEGISADGSRAFFSTTDKLVPGDTDTQTDVYMRSFDADVEGYVTREVSLGPTGGNNAYEAQYLAADAAAGKVFFSTQERLTAADRDNATDIYVRDLAESKTKLVSAGDPSCAASGCGEANKAVDPLPGGVADGGNKVFFVSEEQLAKGDEDSAADVYVRDIAAGTTTLVSAGDPTCVGSCGDGTQPAAFRAASAAGSKAVFTTREALVSEDADSGGDDIYQRDLTSGETKLVSQQGTCPALVDVDVDCTPVFSSASANGSHVFFETNDQINGTDTDSSQDLYHWSGGAPVRASTGGGGGNGGNNALYAGSSSDGSAVFFETKESLSVADADGSQDVYERTGGETILVSEADPSCLVPNCGNGSFDAGVVRLIGVPSGVFAAGAVVFFSTEESLTEADEDSSVDIYRRDLATGSTTLASAADPACTSPECGNGPYGPSFAGAASDGSQVFFETPEALVDSDTDNKNDVYASGGTTTVQVSVGAINGNGNHDAKARGVSENGALAFFTTKERLTDEDDFAGEEDIYSRALPSGPTTLVSQENNEELEAKLAPPPPKLERTDPPSPAASTVPKIIGSEAEAAASIKLYETEDCSGEPVATGDAEELADPGIAVSVDAGTSTSFRATAEAEGFVSTCSAPISYKQEAPAPPPAEEGGGGEGGGVAGGGSTPAPAPSPAPAPAKTHDGIVYVTPVTRITFGPAFKTRARHPAFRFTDSTGQPGTRFICRVDRRQWKSCGSPVRLKNLRRGRHAFRVKAVNAVGVWEARPSRRVFKLVRGAGGHRLDLRHSKRGRR